MSVTISGSGQIVKQVIQTYVPASFSTTSTTAVDVTGLTATITPTNSANKILVQVTAFGGCSVATAQGIGILNRNGTTIGGGTVVGSDSSAFCCFRSGNTSTALPNGSMYLDSPATTSAVTYKIQALVQSGYTLYIGQEPADGNAAASGRYPSIITLMEIAYA